MALPSSVSKDCWLLVTVEYFIVATTELQRFIFWKFRWLLFVNINARTHFFLLIVLNSV